MTASDGAALFEAPPEDQVGAALLPYLRNATDSPALSFVRPPVRILGGFDTLIYGFTLGAAPPELARPLILRIFRDARGPARVHFETTVQNAVAGLGYPTPRVLLLCRQREVLGGAFHVMQRVPGEAMIKRFLRPEVHRLPALLAEQQARLHDLDPSALRASLSAAGFDPAQRRVEVELAEMTGSARAAGLDGLTPGLRWLAEHRPTAAATSICHGDFHPLNLMMLDGKVSGVLDWSRVHLDDPAYDVGATLALLTQAPAGLPAVLSPLVGAVRRWLAERYLRAYATLRPLDRRAVRYYEAFRCLVFLLEAGEKRQASAGVIPPIPKPTAFSDPQVIEAVGKRFRQISGVEVTVSGGQLSEPEPPDTATP